MLIRFRYIYQFVKINCYFSSGFTVIRQYVHSWYWFGYIFSDPPRVKLNLGSGIDRNQISEGQDVYMDCEIRANPRFYKVEWIHNVSSISNIHNIENISLFKYSDWQSY